MSTGKTKIQRALKDTMKCFLYWCYYWNWVLEYIHTKAFSLMQRTNEHRSTATKINYLCATTSHGKSYAVVTPYSQPGSCGMLIFFCQWKQNCQVWTTDWDILTGSYLLALLIAPLIIYFSSSQLIWRNHL